MSIRNDYSYSSNRGIPGGLVDMSPRKVNSRTAEEEIAFGMGVVVGTDPGVTVKLPVAASTATQFEGVAINGGTNEFDLDGKVVVKEAGALSVMRYGNVWVRIAENVEPEYGDALYLITSGDEKGCFTNEAAATPAEGQTATSTTIALKGRFLTADTAAGIASVELYNQSQN